MEPYLPFLGLLHVTVNSKDRGVYEEEYDALILSLGAKPLKPTLPGIDSSRIFTLRNIPDTDRIKSYVDQEGDRSAIVISGGYFGVEMAEIPQLFSGKLQLQ